MTKNICRSDSEGKFLGLLETKNLALKPVNIKDINHCTNGNLDGKLIKDKRCRQDTGKKGTKSN